MTLTEKRCEDYKRLANIYGIRILGPHDRPRDSGEEDLQEILHSHEEPGAWASVTHSGGYYYVRSWATEEAAKEYASEGITDPIYAETLIAVVNVDRWEWHRPKISVSWEQEAGH